MRPNRRAFTLIELLTVVAIVAILAGLVAASISVAGTRATAAQCGNNLRQINIGLQGFLSVHGEYPLNNNWGFLNGLQTHHLLQALSTLHREVYPDTPIPNGTQRFTNGVFWCPRARPVERKGGEPYSAYGYNAWGDGTSTGSSGLGGSGTESQLTPVRESEVVAPASTYALGDGFQGRLPETVDGRSVIGNWSAMEPFDGSRERIQSRHQGSIMMAYCDGHLVQIPVSIAFGISNAEARRSWNKDHEIHHP